MRLDNNQKAFFELLKAGLFPVHGEGLMVQGLSLDNSSSVDWCWVDFQEVMRLAEEQSVVGLITAGMEQVVDKVVPKIELLQFIGQTLQIEEQNKNMNSFIAEVTEQLRKEKIHAVLVKGQGVARCYEKPLWRSSGDVDLLLDKDNYEEAKAFFAKMASSIEPEEYVAKHIGFNVDQWLVELHGHMYFGLSYRAYRVVLEAEREILKLRGIRVWNNNGTDVYLPNPDNDIIILFTHFLGHFCFGGVGLRQLCDMCRLLWTYRDTISKWQLKQRLERMGLMSEWRVFLTLATKYLGMPEEVSSSMFQVPSNSKYEKKAERALARIMKAGNLGHNVDEIYAAKYPRWQASVMKFGHRFGEFLNLMTIFPVDAHRFFINYLIDKVRIGRARRKRG